MKIPQRELRFVFTRSSGPGGQNVNKTSTKVHLKWKPLQSVALSTLQKNLLLQRLGYRLEKDGELDVTSEKTRSQQRNREDAVARLQQLVAWAIIPPKLRKKTIRRAGKRWRVEKQLRQKKKKHRSATRRASEDN